MTFLSLSQSYTLKQETVNGGLGLNSLKLHHLGAKTHKNSLNFDRLFASRKETFDDDKFELNDDFRPLAIGRAMQRVCE